MQLLRFEAKASCKVHTASAATKGENEEHEGEEHADHDEHEEHEGEEHADHDEHEEHEGEEHADHDEHENEEVHGAFVAEYEFECTNIDALGFIEFNYFNLFNNAQSLDIVLIDGSGQRRHKNRSRQSLTAAEGMNQSDNLQDPEMQAGSDSLLALNEVRFHWPGRDGFALSVESFSLGYGEKLFLKGPSGSGKSTLLSLICGIVPPDSGSICIDGVDIAQLSASRADRMRADKLGIIFQQFNLLPYGSMLQNVLLPLQFSQARRERASAGGTPEDEARRLLQRLGLAAEQHTRGVTRLSIGQQQRVAVARAIIGNPRLIIADEANLGARHR